MFIKAYRSTLKNLFRAPLFWLISAVVMVMAINYFSSGHFAVYLSTLGELINDTDPRYVQFYDRVIVHAANSGTYYLGYILPVLSIVSVVIILNRDYGDNFYEIEKAAGIRPSTYLFARLSALITVNYVITFIVGMLSFYMYFAVHGDVGYIEMPDATIMGVQSFISDSFLRVVRNIVFCTFPTITVYVVFTYFVGCIFRSGMIASILSVIYVVFSFAIDTFYRVMGNGLANLYRDYLGVKPEKLYKFFYRFDTPAHEGFIVHHETSFERAMICMGIFAAFTAVYMLISYLRVRRRDK